METMEAMINIFKADTIKDRIRRRLREKNGR